MLDKMATGVWIVAEIPNGKQMKKIADKISELPEVLNRARFEPYVYSVMNKLSKILKDSENSYLLGLSKYVSAKEITDVVISCLKK
uniref:Uncharacterized protein n=1 Tax=viral metagenome TaxID=1070528 RepID=A0A6M3JRR9_9ZZZZ